MKNDPCWKGYEMIGTKKKNGKEVPNCVPKEEACCDDCADPIEEEAEHEGRKVTLNKPFGGDSKHKRYVYVKNEKGNVIKLGFGDPNMEIKRDDPERRKAYRARHNCDNPGPKWKANYWSCKYWSSTPTSKLDEATTIHLPRKYMHAGSEMEDQVSAAIHKAAGSPKMHSIDFKFGVRFEVERDGKKDQKLTDILRKNLKEESISFQTYLEGVERDKVDLAISKEVDRDKERHDRMRDQADRVDAASTKAQNRRLANEGIASTYARVKLSTKDKARVMQIVSDLSDTPGYWDHKKMTFSAKGELELAKALKNNKSEIAYAKSLDYSDFEESTSNAVSIPMYVQEAAYDGNIGMMELAKFYMKASPADKQKLQDAIKNKRFKEAWKMVEKVTGVKLKGAEFATEEVTDEEVAANSVAGGGVDMNPTGKPKWDKRSKFHIDHIFRRADGTKYKKNKANE